MATPIETHINVNGIGLPWSTEQVYSAEHVPNRQLPLWFSLSIHVCQNKTVTDADIIMLSRIISWRFDLDVSQFISRTGRQFLVCVSVLLLVSKSNNYDCEVIMLSFSFHSRVIASTSDEQSNNCCPFCRYSVDFKVCIPVHVKGLESSKLLSPTENTAHEMPCH